MTRKDYIALAQVLRIARPRAFKPNECTTVQPTYGAMSQWEHDRAAIADALAADNERFDRKQFYEACEGART